MAPFKCGSRLEVPQPSFYSSPVAYSSSTSDVNSTSATPLSPRTLYAQSFDHSHTFTFDRPPSSRSLPSAGRFRKNMKDITGFGTTDEEFEALPIAVRKKYFSTLERLRFAQSSRNTLNEVRLPIQTHRKSSIADRRGLNIPVIDPRRKASTSRPRRKLARQHSIASHEASWFLTLPDKIKKKEFTREEQLVLAGRLRESVILDAADEAIYKASYRASRNITLPLDLPIPSSRTSMDNHPTNPETTSTMTDAIYESFRWMDEEEDLDLRLVLDDYHANLDGFVIPTPNSTRRPSFRRTMSISKMPFGRTSLSSIQPRSPTSVPNTHSRQKSRALSLIGPKHSAHDSISSIDPNATHYQDPEARLKLRVYLASPQKFDEAIEFGFPSMDGVADGPDKENKPPRRTSKDLVGRKSHATERGFVGALSFLNDDTASLFEDDASMAEPDSPLTPMGADMGLRPRGISPACTKGSKTPSDFSHLVPKPTLLKQPDSYAQAMAGSREMTLRMTLTRPDLRADENTIYAWQTTAIKSPLREEPLAVDVAEEKYEVRGPLGGIDGWGPSEKENGVVKRFWNKVKSSQKKV